MMNSFRTTRTTLVFRPLNVMLVALLLLALVAPPGANADDCQNLQVQAGNTVAFHVYAEGVQIYNWTGTSWSPVGPEAVLYADAGHTAVVGIHYASPAGPTRPAWESVSGSKVVGAVIDRCTPDPDAIPWLLLRAVSSEGPGVFNHVTFIQRVNTVGGKAPTDAGDTVGEEARVAYSTEYLFYKKSD